MSGSPTVFKRMELKYRLSAVRFRPFLAALREYAEPDAYGQYTIGSLYYDTPAYDLIRASLEKPVYKEKLRLRGYGIPKASDTVYLELKKKYNGEVFKRRVPLPLETAARYMRTGEKPHPSCQVLEEIDWFTRCRPLQPAAYLAYDRTALFDRADPGVRITFDERIRYRADHLDLSFGDEGALLFPDGTVVMEIKLPGSMPLWLSRLLDSFALYPVSVSKYGTCYREHLFPESTKEGRIPLCSTRLPEASSKAG